MQRDGAGAGAIDSASTTAGRAPSGIPFLDPAGAPLVFASLLEEKPRADLECADGPFMSDVVHEDVCIVRPIVSHAAIHVKPRLGKQKPARSTCEHGRTPYRCRPCGGKAFCEHDRRRSRCRPCINEAVCRRHGLQRSMCHECRSAGEYCEHGKRRSRCRACGGGSICEHNRQRSQCRPCGGGEICAHDRQRSKCRECNEARAQRLKLQSGEYGDADRS